MNEYNENPSCFALDGCPLNDIEDLFNFNDDSLTAGQFFSSVDSPNTIPESPPPIVDETTTHLVHIPALEIKEKKKRKKVAKACKECRKAHVSCDEVRPCKRCTKRNLCCSDVPDVQQKCKKCPAKLSRAKLTRNQNGVVKLNEVFEYDWNKKMNIVISESNKILNSPQQPMMSRNASISSINSNTIFSENPQYQLPVSESPSLNLFPDLESLRLFNSDANTINGLNDLNINKNLNNNLNDTMNHNNQNNHQNNHQNNLYLNMNNMSFQNDSVLNLFTDFSSHDSAIYDLNTPTEGDSPAPITTENRLNFTEKQKENLNYLLDLTKKSNYQKIIEKLDVIMNSPLVTMGLGDEKDGVIDLFNCLRQFNN
ncbi:hypothetical protein HK099_001986 [Clydaea vesicula]|uniref:Zn(2)-C6 fungal-type domain-containing protein n=1 Tax=Clydaea vesicula TaxID=447962 RepID=A0AAD5Y108_9FUNG|nr:hypothetical protein HK099_001986 [Clydaea vesicula]